MAVLAAMSSDMIAARASRTFDLKKLDDSELIDLLEADPDDPFLIKGREGIMMDVTAAPTMSPRDLVITPAPSPASVYGPTSAPSASPTASATTRGLTTSAPVSETEDLITSGVWRPMPVAAAILAVIMLSAVSGTVLI